MEHSSCTLLHAWFIIWLLADRPSSCYKRQVSLHFTLWLYELTYLPFGLWYAMLQQHFNASCIEWYSRKFFFRLSWRHPFFLKEHLEHYSKTAEGWTYSQTKVLLPEKKSDLSWPCHFNKRHNPWSDQETKGHNYSVPTDPTNFHQFLGLVSYYSCSSIVPVDEERSCFWVGYCPSNSF